MQLHSIKSHLSLVFYVFLFLLILLGLLSIERLRGFNLVSAEIRDHWLQDTRILGALDDRTSDYRTAEGSHVLSHSPAETIEREQELRELEASLAQAQTEYGRIRHNPEEADLYARFLTSWNEYRTAADQVLELSRAKRKEDAA